MRVSSRFLVLLLILLLALTPMTFIVQITPAQTFHNTPGIRLSQEEMSKDFSSFNEIRMEPPNLSTLPQYFTMNYSSHVPMVITSDDDFISLGWNGTGTINDPYFLSNLHIINNESMGIAIYDTRAHFVINHCFITGDRVGIKYHVIYCENVSNGVVMDSVFQYSWTGVLLNLSDSNQLIRNWYTDTRNGIQLLTANNNQVRNNSLIDNSLGLDLDQGTNNEFWWNVFAGNRLNAFDNGGPNVFEYNYWSTYLYGDANDDGIGDVVFQVPGTARTLDHHPLMWLPVGHPVVWNRPMDTNFIVEAGWFFTLLLEAAVAYPGTLFWAVNNSAQFNVTEGLLQSRDGLFDDYYVLNISVSDTLGYSIQTLIVLTVWDTRAPEWIDPPDYLMFWANDEPLAIHFNASDPSGIDTFFVEDSEHFQINETGHLTNRTVLVLNTLYDIWVSVNDTWGHTTSIGVSLIVIVPLPPRLPEIYYQVAWAVIVLSLFLLIGFVWHFLKWKHYRTDIYY